MSFAAEQVIAREALDDMAFEFATVESQLATAKDEIAALQAENAELRERIQELEAAQPTPEPEYILRETFPTPLDPAKFIYLCHEAAKNFTWVEPGSFDVIFIAGKTTGSAVSSSSGKVLRSELMWRKAGEPPTSGVPESIPVGESYEIILDFTIPADYDPAVSSAPNEKRNIFQLWESSSASPFALELIRPNGPPWNGVQNIVRIVAAGVVRWLHPVSPGNRYQLKIGVLLDPTTGSLRVEGLGDPFIMGGIATCHGTAAQMVPHFGIYEPGAADDPIGARTVIRFHEVSIA